MQDIKRLMEYERRAVVVDIAGKVARLAQTAPTPQDFQQRVLSFFDNVLTEMEKDMIERPDISDFTVLNQQNERPYITYAELERVMPEELQKGLWIFAAVRKLPTNHKGPIGLYVDDVREYLESL
jgi:hypothetical protein